MLKIHLTLSDLMRSRMVVDLGPWVETVFALQAFRCDSDLRFHRWRRSIRAGQPDLVVRCDELLRRCPTLRHLVDRFCVPSSSGRAGGASSDDVRTLREFAAVAVEPHWSEVSRHLEEVRRVRGRTVIAGGMERLLGSLHPQVYWESPVLSVRDGTDRDVHLDGHGLVLAPSFYMHDKDCVLIEPGAHTLGRTALAFPVSATMKVERDPREEDGQQIGDLMGRTRSAALQVLTDSCTTGELARRLKISLAGASQHAAVLRRAGLITTSRKRNTAMHSLTPLGADLLRGPVAVHGPSPADDATVRVC